MRTKAERKHNDYKKIKHKINIMKDVYKEDETAFKHDLYDKEKNRLNKSKVHCSCQDCSSKIKNCGIKHSDKIKLDEMDYQEREYQDYYPEREY